MTKMTEHWSTCERIAKVLNTKKSIVHNNWYKIKHLSDPLLSGSVPAISEATKLIAMEDRASEATIQIGDLTVVKSAIIAIGPGPKGATVYLISGEALDVEVNYQSLQTQFNHKA